MNKVKYETPKMEVVYFENGAIDTSETSYEPESGITPGDNELPFHPAN